MSRGWNVGASSDSCSKSNLGNGSYPWYRRSESRSCLCRCCLLLLHLPLPLMLLLSLSLSFVSFCCLVLASLCVVLCLCLLSDVVIFIRKTTVRCFVARRKYGPQVFFLSRGPFFSFTGIVLMMYRYVCRMALDSGRFCRGRCTPCGGTGQTDSRVPRQEDGGDEKERPEPVFVRRSIRRTTSKVTREIPNYGRDRG